MLAVHAHPDDESRSTGGVLAFYAQQGVRVVLVMCTSGELGDMPGGIKPGDLDHHPQAVATRRRAQLFAACDVLGVTDLELLGYHDSGETGQVPPGAFCSIPVETAAGRVAALIEHYRPQVVVTHDHHNPHQHRDHVHAARVAHLAAKETGIPAKLYLEAHESLATTTIDTSSVAELKRKAMYCYESQSLIGKLTARQRSSTESYIRAIDTTNAPLPETDLFAGIRHHGPDLPRW
ncbi:N-acetylglucosaminyl deacetylase, LmbE family [Lentzea jiangxiensis]|uniref:N-acetylglucosaminyl deacetylase, LmbE family n=1 Tax=Lentzea jiangxiensis TaxID=641025 RepID=A0A1H0PS63_9PSEU|nr:N-acetylglucosaminyl deacetylase, LmbE family [Lentzea jiangxiensis]